jgi:threonine dehydratase
MIPLSLVLEAKNRLNNITSNTPFSYAPILSKVSGAEIFLKKENLQLTGSFKIRGAFNKISSLTNEERQKGIVAASAGNHAQGVAFSGNYYKIPATIVMPDSTPLTKINGVASYGANVVLHGSNYDEAYKKALELAKQKNYTFIHPFADDEVIAGQATIALEMLEEVSDLDIVVVPVGGGGLISGVAAYIKALNPKIKVIGVTAAGAPAMRNSYIDKKAQDTISVRTIADGIAVRDTTQKTLDYLLESVDDVVEVCDEEIASAILFLMEKQKLIVEGAGAVGIASILHDKIENIKDKKVGVILSGGNIDVTMLSVIIEKGLLKTNRKMKLMVTLIDKPGSLAKLTQILEQNSANIVQIDYDRTSASLDYGDANVTLSIETKGLEDQEKIKNSLKENGFKFKDL